MARRKKGHIDITEACAEHFPGGVPDGTTSVGCAHGTFYIDAADAPATEPPAEDGQDDGDE